MAARNVVASQQPEVTNDSVNTVRKEDENQDSRMNIDRHEKIDADASFSQQASIDEPPPPTPAPTPDVWCASSGQTAFEERTLDSHAHADVLPHASVIESDPVSDGGCDQNCSNAKADAEAGNDTRPDENHFRLHPAVSEAELDDNGNKIQRRQCLKRKHDSLDNAASSNDRNSSAKVACIVRSPVTQQNASPPPSPNLNGLLSALKTATLTKSENGDNENASAVSPLSRSLSCSSFMELTCES